MERRRAGKRKKSAFVPSVVFTTAVVGVVPACVAGCTGGPGPGPVITVACSMCGVAAVAYVGYDSGSDAKDGASDAAGDAAPDGTGPADAPSDTILGVADTGFGSG